MIKLISSFIAISIIISSSVSATQERYPTNSEIKTLRQQFRQLITRVKSDKTGSGYIRDIRSSAERQARNSFVTSWSKVDPSIASFLGSWSGYEDTYHIYPSKKQRKVCIVRTGEGHGSFIVGTISNGNIFTESHGSQVVLFREGIYLGSASISKGKPKIATDIPYNSPRLESIAKLTSLSFEEAEKSSIRQGFNENGCISPTPN
jgi:hypothetical protein